MNWTRVTEETCIDWGYREMEKENPHIGSSLDDFLKDEGILEETRDTALKETLARQARESVKKIKRN